jgi:hypothetical protein
MSQVNTELGLSSTATISLNDAAVRNLAGVPSGAIGMNNLQGKSNVFAFSIASNQIDANLRTLAVNAGWNGTIPVQATINGGVWISGSATGNSTAALTISGSFPNGVTLINNGTIAGNGGNGGGGAHPSGTAGGGGTGGLALTASVGVTIQNNGTIAGGGGGGGGGGWGQSTYNYGMDDSNTGRLDGNGGGGGGGRSNVSYNTSGGGFVAAAWSGLTPTTVTNPTAGGTGTSGGPGSGGVGAYLLYSPRSTYAQGGSGGAGGGWGSGGGNGANAIYNSGFRYDGAAGGGAGYAVTGNGNISWTAFGTRLGPIG